MKKIILLLLVVMSTHLTLAQNDDFSKHTFINAQNDSLNYRLLVPENIQKGKKYPLVLFLYGAGERGKDNESQLRNGGTLFSNPSNREKYPSFVLFPQCPSEFYWFMDKRPEQGFKNGNPFAKNVPASSQTQLVMELLDDFIQKNPVDERRIYVMGLSMGAMATFDIVCRQPDRFAAAIPICGGVNLERLHELKTSTKFRIYHGDIDDVVPVGLSREAYKALKKSGKEVEYIEFYGVNHNSWHPAFNSPDFLSWLYKIKK